jgi:hypothetical protein
MKLNASVLMSVAMMVGSMALGTGCTSGDRSAQPESTPAPVAQETPVAAAPAQPAAPAAKDESTTVKASVSVGVDAQRPVYAPSAPPAPRYEYVGRPPSERHSWIKGHWRWSGRDWVWISGRWEARRAGFVHEGAHWEYQHGRYHFVPGHWVRR